ncbi:phenylalanine--tRNA ligase alpha subunit [Striga asiatica]|uniref:Phenylalanine--tRNA ligase alpha subunit n=1 Tax=Striga asiatica TaxID=4170 RepID=A0A5A7QC14_STRAF|nr:phenylalanine--tRNA ligase alpha subunit [Striga asiatica]
MAKVDFQSPAFWCNLHRDRKKITISIDQNIYSDVDALKKRKHISSQIWKGYSVKKGPKYASKRKKVATDLNRENLQRSDWKEIEFKEYNFLAKGQPTEGGSSPPDQIATGELTSTVEFSPEKMHVGAARLSGKCCHAGLRRARRKMAGPRHKLMDVAEGGRNPLSTTNCTPFDKWGAFDNLGRRKIDQEPRDVQEMKI